MENYALLLQSDEPIMAPAPLAAALSPIVGKPAGELSRRFREMPWILLSEVPADQMDPIFAVLSARHISARAVPEAHMPELTPALRIRVADPTPESFFLESAEPPAPPVLRWGDLQVVSTGLVEVSAEEASDIFGSWKGEKPAAARRPAKDIPGSVSLTSGGRTPTEALIADFFARGEKPLRLRIDAGHFKYDYLRKRMGTSSRVNLKLLLEDVRARAPEAHFTERTRRFLEGDAVDTYKFKSLTAFESYHRWVIQSREETAG